VSNAATIEQMSAWEGIVPQEIELKFALAGWRAEQALQRLSQHPLLRRRKRQQQRLINRYYDTPDGWLRQQRCALRIRAIEPPPGAPGVPSGAARPVRTYEQTPQNRRQRPRRFECARGVDGPLCGDPRWMRPRYARHRWRRIRHSTHRCGHCNPCTRPAACAPPGSCAAATAVWSRVALDAGDIRAAGTTRAAAGARAGAPAG
jgi:hypothetical protein